MPGCSSCGGTTIPASGYSVDSNAHPWIDVNEYGVRPIGDEPASCQPYHGEFQGTTVFLVGYGTDEVKVFLRGARTEAWTYAQENDLSFQHINVVELCHDRVIGLLGA